MKTALICGVSGQDGAYLSRLLIDNGYRVHGASRDAQMSQFDKLHALGIASEVQLESMNITDFRSVLQTLDRVQPDEVYNLAGQSSVGLSFEQPVETLESISIGTLNLLEAIRFTRRAIRFYNAGSSECFGDTPENGADENTAFRPRSPYAVAKAAAFWQVANYREAYSLHACTGILFNHESPLRPKRFVTRKIVAGAARIANGSGEKLHLGNIGIKRDWGWAPEYVDAMWRIMQHDQPDDFVIGTGTSYSLESFVQHAFAAVALDWRDHVVIDNAFMRPTDISIGTADPRKAKRVLGWTATFTMPDVVRMMMDAEQAQ